MFFSFVRPRPRRAARPPRPGRPGTASFARSRCWTAAVVVRLRLPPEDERDPQPGRQGDEDARQQARPPPGSAGTTATPARPARPRRAAIGRPARNRLRSSARAAAVGYRRPGSFAIALRTTVSRSRGMQPVRPAAGGAGSSRPHLLDQPQPVGLVERRPEGEQLVQGHPEAVHVAPRVGPPRNRSGAMYRRVPRMSPVPVRSAASVRLGQPEVGHPHGRRRRPAAGSTASRPGGAPPARGRSRRASATCAPIRATLR